MTCTSGPGACRHVFAQLGYNDGHLTPRGWELFKDYSDKDPFRDDFPFLPLF